MSHSHELQTSIVQVGGFRPGGDPQASNFGLSPLANPGELWPVSNGSPMLHVCQLNLTTAPARPPLIADLEMLTFFVDPDSSNLGQENGSGWRLFAYPSVKDLVPMVRPADAPKLKRGFECVWLTTNDPSADRTKIGGEPSVIQSEPWWDYQAHPAEPQYCLQINSEEKVGLAWGDAGMVYLARGTASGHEYEWFLDWQCY